MEIQRFYIFLISLERQKLLKSSRLSFLKHNFMQLWVQVRTRTPAQLSVFSSQDSSNSRTHVLERTGLEPGKSLMTKACRQNK